MVHVIPNYQHSSLILSAIVPLNQTLDLVEYFIHNDMDYDLKVRIEFVKIWENCSALDLTFYLSIAIAVYEVPF